MTLVYEYRPEAVYINLTNRCTCRCVFCAKTRGIYTLGQFDLKLDQEPTAEQVIQDLELFLKETGRPVSTFREFVFCGYGEPTLRSEVMIQVARYLKSKGAFRIRLNTNGHLLLLSGQESLDNLASCMDVISVSLNAADKATYNQLCSPRFGSGTFRSIVEFIRRARDLVPEVMVTVVDEGSIDIHRCRALANELGVKLRVR